VPWRLQSSRLVSGFKEGWVVIDVVLRDDVSERKDEKEYQRHTVEPKSRIGSKAESLVQSENTQYDEAIGAKGSEPFEPRMDQGGTDALSLPFRPKGDRLLAVRACARSIDLNGKNTI
jgi:hypothetical protein